MTVSKIIFEPRFFLSTRVITFFANKNNFTVRMNNVLNQFARFCTAERGAFLIKINEKSTTSY